MNIKNHFIVYLSDTPDNHGGLDEATILHEKSFIGGNKFGGGGFKRDALRGPQLQEVVLLTFPELSKIFSRNVCIPKNRISY